MILDWFNAREAVELGVSLADQFALTSSTGEGRRVGARNVRPDVQKFLQRAINEARPLRLNLFKRAKLVETFKSKLLARGMDQNSADELTHLLLLQLSGGSKGSASAPKAASVQAPSRRVAGLMAEANARFAEGLYAEAATRLEEVIALEPRHAVAHANLGTTFCNLGRYREAEKELRRALELKATCPGANLSLGRLLHNKGEFWAAETALRRAVKQDPRDPQALVDLGFTLIMQARVEDARSCIERALRLTPKHAGALGTLGRLKMLEGRFDEAEHLLRAALEADPKRIAPHALLAYLRPMMAADKSWLDTAEHLLAEGVGPLEEAKLRFAMGKYYDDLGKHSRAFEQYKRANELQKDLASPYDRSARSRMIDDVIRVYSRERLTQGVQDACDAEKPIFVVGMMRSGTSLVEQIIASHPNAAGAGELDFWGMTAHKQQDILRNSPPDGPLIRRLAESYLKILERHSADALRVVDKATFNTDLLGLIHTVFPKARILYLQRDPVDTCLSCYFQDFANMASFTMDLSDLAHYYREHHRLVQHWRAVLPKDVFLEVPYAELVADQEGWSRKIIEFIGLPWDPKVLEFHKTERAVITASNWQVRQKIYSSSVGRWKNYEKFIGPLLPLRKLG